VQKSVKRNISAVVVVLFVVKSGSCDNRGAVLVGVFSNSRQVYVEIGQSVFKKVMCCLVCLVIVFVKSQMFAMFSLFCVVFVLHSGSLASFCQFIFDT